jgi:hypothetical protein
MTLLWAHSGRPALGQTSLCLCVSVVKEGKNFSVSLW